MRDYYNNFMNIFCEGITLWFSILLVFLRLCSDQELKRFGFFFFFFFFFLL